MHSYLDILRDVRENGTEKRARNGIMLSKFATRFRHDFKDGFPLLTSKRINPRLPLAEMFAFFKGATNLEGFHEFGVNIWDQWGLKEHKTVFKPYSPEEIAEMVAQKKGISTAEAAALHHSVLAAWVNYHEALRLSAWPRELLLTDHDKELWDWFQTNPPQCASEGEWLISMGLSNMNFIEEHREGDLGPIYGKQWLGWRAPDGTEINQLKQVVELLKNNPQSRRIVLTAWNPADIADDNIQGQSPAEKIKESILAGKMALPPCHLMSIFYVDSSTLPPRLCLHQIMRSSDVPVGLPFNIAGYSYMVYLLAAHLGYQPGELVIDSTDAHIYPDQVEYVDEQLTREPRPLPTLTVPDDIDITNPDHLTVENIDRIVAGLSGYDPHPFIKYPVTT